MRKTIRIEVLIDFAFKKVFGSTGNEVALIGLLNALLTLRSPIAKVRILNPYNDKDFEEDKLSICLFRGSLWPKDSVFHHCFQLAEAELAAASASDRWLFWLLYSHLYSSEELTMRNFGRSRWKS